MNIDLSKVDEKGLIIDETVSFGPEYIEKTSIQKLDNVEVKGRVYYSITNEVVLECTAKGSFVLLDAISLEPLDYPFDLKISEVLASEEQENSKNDTKKLDIMDILWQNIVLEVPISVRAHPEKKYDLSGEGWELVDEEKKKLDPRLAPLLELLDKEGKE